MKRPILTASHIAVATMYLSTTTVWTSSRNPGSIEHPRLRPAQASYTIRRCQCVRCYALTRLRFLQDRR